MLSRAIAVAMLIYCGATCHVQAFDTSTLEQRGSLLLSDLNQILRQNGLLHQQVRVALQRTNLAGDSVRCEGSRFPGSWQYLGGHRVAPYICALGDERLVIQADVDIRDGDGDAYVKNTEAARKYGRF